MLVVQHLLVSIRFVATQQLSRQVCYDLKPPVIVPTNVVPQNLRDQLAPVAPGNLHRIHFRTSRAGARRKLLRRRIDLPLGARRCRSHSETPQACRSSVPENRTQPVQNLIGEGRLDRDRRNNGVRQQPRLIIMVTPLRLPGQPQRDRRVSRFLRQEFQEFID
jgi:hypothetical protein